ncbi:hypothetical protein [Actinoplanes sp. NPDC051851]|uniref:LppU/SCO3897 family protein n=1 Tax=Actinoplanes sp. NPDC051851 TaxID=3154753 RepID=UPI003429CD1C
MSHNGPYSGPPWSGRPEEPYAEPSDPWGEHDPGWQSQIPHQPSWNAPPPAPPAPAPGTGPGTGSGPRRGFAMGALVAVISVLVGGGLATTVWFLVGRDKPAETPAAVATTTGVTGPQPRTSEDARFAAKGQCVRNEGSNTEPELRIVVCAANTYEVLKRIDGKTTGEKDAVSKCAQVTGYTKWYYYDTEYDDVDFVLCLREYQPQ